MKSQIIIGGVLVGAGLVCAWYGLNIWVSGSSQEQQLPQAQVPSDGAPVSYSPPQEAGALPTISVLKIRHDDELGDYLTAQNGLALYYSTNDSVGVTRCENEKCIKNWPPYTPVAGQMLVAEPAIRGELGTVLRSDGSSQLTYRGMPLYYFVGDKKVGDVVGADVSSRWFIAKP